MYYMCVNFVGHCSQVLSEVTVRRAFIDRRHYINNTIKKNYEKDREVCKNHGSTNLLKSSSIYLKMIHYSSFYTQDQLLQSILPKHISVKVKEEMRQEIKMLEEANKPDYRESSSSMENNYSSNASRRSSSNGRRGSQGSHHRPSIQRKPFT